MKKLMTLAELKAADIGMVKSFELDIPGKETLECLDVYRHLPGKRLVFRAQWGGTDALVKLFFQRKYFERERDGLRAIAAAGVPCPKEIWSFNAGEEGCLLATEYLEDAVSLDDCYRGLAPTQLKPLLRDALAHIGQLHRAGWMQADIHLDNFLLSQGRLYVIDGGGVSKLEDAVKNTGLFFAQMIPDYDGLIADIIDAYGNQSPSLEAVLSIALDQREWRIKHYTKKSLRDCTQFVVSRPPGAFVVSARKMVTPGLTEVMTDPEIVFGNAEFLKRGNTSTVVKVPGDESDWVLKRYNIKDFWHGVSRALRPSRACASWQSGYRLELLGIATPKPLAMRENRAGFLRREAYLLTEWSGGESLDEWVLHVGDTQIPAWLGHEVFRLFDILWHARVSHGDMKATNLMVTGEQLQVIDLDAMRWHRSGRSFAKAFAKDLQRFMDNWQGETWQHFQQILQPLAERAGIILKNNRV